MKHRLKESINVHVVVVDMMKKLLQWMESLMTNLQVFINECEENLSKIKTFIELKNELEIDISEYDTGVLHGKKDSLQKIVNYLNQQN